MCIYLISSFFKGAFIGYGVVNCYTEVFKLQFFPTSIERKNFCSTSLKFDHECYTTCSTVQISLYLAIRTFSFA